MSELRVIPITHILHIGTAAANMLKESQNINALNAATKVIQDPESYNAARLDKAYQTVAQFIAEYPDIPASRHARGILQEHPPPARRNFLGLGDAPAPAPAQENWSPWNELPDVQSPFADRATEMMQANIQRVQQGIDQRRQLVDKYQAEIAQLQALIPGGSKQKAPVIPNAPMNQPTAPTAPTAPAANQGWGQGVGEFARNLLNIPGNLQRGWQQAAPTADSNTTILTASMGSASALYSK